MIFWKIQTKSFITDYKGPNKSFAKKHNEEEKITISLSKEPILFGYAIDTKEFLLYIKTKS